MEPKVKPIPAFYCCYLLRSTIRHASLYVGSSPHPSRRLAQHNGKAKGGAVRTSRLSLRPWEMTCIVAGFPSNIAALQFEWAWQNSHLTRHVSPDERISFPVTVVKTNRKTGKTRNKPGRPRTSLVERLSNLHLLLRTTYFSQWPLELRFFSQDVYRAWQSWCERVDAQVRSEIRIVLDLPPSEPVDEETFSSAQRPAKRRKIDLIGKGGVEGVDPTFARYQDIFEKSRFLLDEDEQHGCAICAAEIDISNDLFSLCTSHDCTSMSHITCLAEKFLRDSGGASVVPVRGSCPSCQAQVEWAELMRVVSLRTRGDKEIQKLMKTKRKTKAATAVELMDDDDDHDDHDSDDDGKMVAEVDSLPLDNHSDKDDDNLSVLSIESSGSVTQAGMASSISNQAENRFEIVIEDSEDER